MISSSQRPPPDNTQHSQQTDIHAPGEMRTHDLSRRAAVDLRLRPRGHWDRQTNKYSYGICITEFAINVRNDNPRPLYTSWHVCETHQFTRTSPLQGTQHSQCGGAMHLVFPCSTGTPSISLYAMKAYGGVNAYLQPIFKPCAISGIVRSYAGQVSLRLALKSVPLFTDYRNVF
jgi:hypothetical protein